MLALLALSVRAPAAEIGTSEDRLMPSDARSLEAARLGGDYLARITGPDGNFVYAYDPLQDRVLPGYNWLRHAGTIAALAQIHEVSGDAEHLAAAERATRRMLQQVQTIRVQGREFRALVSDPKSTGENPLVGPVVKAGGNALAIFALDSLDRASGGRLDHRADMQALGHYLHAVRKSDGIPMSKLILNHPHFSEWESAYYPGQCLLAFAILQHRMPTEAWDEALHRLAGTLFERIEARVRSKAPGDFDHWAMIGLRAALPQLDFERLSSPQRTVDLAHFLRVLVAYGSGEILTQQVAPEIDSIGSFAIQKGRTTPTAIRVEGLLAIRSAVEWAAARDASFAEWKRQVADWESHFRLARGFLIRSQYDRPVAGGAGGIDPTGGVRNSARILDAGDGKIQIDYVQHAISAWIDPY